MRNFQEFIDKKIAVSFADEKEQMEFLKLCKENGLKWRGMDTTSSMYKPLWMGFSTPIVENYYGNEKGILSTGMSPLRKDEFKIVPASEFLTQSAPTIEIFQSKQTVVCLKKQDGKVVAVGKAKCNPDDAFDFEFGATLAFQRMIGMEPLKPPFDISEYEQGVKTLKNGMKIRKQDRYKAGDKVLMKKKTGLTLLDEMKDCVGKVCTIKDLDGGIELEESGGYCFLNGDIKGKVIE